MAKTVADPHVLQATNQPNMLQNLEEANGLLDEIMKGNRTIILIIFIFLQYKKSIKLSILSIVKYQLICRIERLSREKAVVFSSILFPLQRRAS